MRLIHPRPTDHCVADHLIHEDKPTAIIGQKGFEALVTALWQKLPPELRRTFGFGFSFTPADFLPENKMTGLGLLGCVSTTNSWVVGNTQASADLDYIRKGSIYSYTPNPGVYHCPADHSTVFGASTTRTRSYSMDSYLNGGLDVGIYGGYLPGIVVKESELGPNPAGVFVFLDENEDTIEDGVFLLYREPADFWQNGPAHRHSRGANLSFADGHCERWQWKYPNGIQGNGQTAANAQDLEDLHRLQAALPLAP